MNINVLLIEDDEGDAFLIKEMLADVVGSRYNFQWVDSLSGGVEALRKSKPGDIDIVLLDLTLPDSSGLNTLHKIKPEMPKTPVVVLTGLDDEGIAYEAMRNGAQDYLVKGRIDIDSLSRSIRYSIQRQKIFSDLIDLTWHLQMSEMRFKDIVENNADGILLVDSDDKILLANQACSGLFGRKPEDLMGSLFGFPMVEGENTEIQIIRPEGDTIYAEMRLAQTVWDGKPSFLASLHDITERKNAEMHTRHLNKVLKALRKVGQLMVKVKDRHELVENICETLVSTRGYRTAWIVLTGEFGEYRYVANAGEPDDFAAILEHWKDGEIPSCARETILTSGVSVRNSETSNLYKEESCRQANREHCAYVARLEHNDRLFGILRVSLSNDFTLHSDEKELFGELADDIAFALHNIEIEGVRLQAEDKIKQMAVLQDSSIDNAGVWLNVIDPDGKILVWNKTAEKVSGYSSDEAIGRADIWEKLYPDVAQRQKVLEQTQRIIDERSGFNSLESVICCKSGENKTIAWHLRNLTDELGKVVGAIMLGRDVTEHKQAEDDLRRTTQWLKSFGDNGDPKRH